MPDFRLRAGLTHVDARHNAGHDGDDCRSDIRIITLYKLIILIPPQSFSTFTSPGSLRGVIMRRREDGTDGAGRGGDAPRCGGDTATLRNDGVGARTPVEQSSGVRKATPLARPLRAWLVTTHPGGSGTPLGRHYDRSARSLLDWDRMQKSTSQEARPGVAADNIRQKCRQWSAVRRGVLRTDAAAFRKRG
jgi:hypothetical protein